MDFCLTAVVIAVVWGLGVMFGRRARAGEHSGIPTGLHPKSHDEPIEDTAKPIDEPRHGESGDEQAHEYGDIRRGLGQR